MKPKAIPATGCARSAFQALGIKPERAALMADQFDRRDRQAMIDSAQLYRKDVPLSQNAPFLAKIKELLAEAENDLLCHRDSNPADRPSPSAAQEPKP